MFCFKRKIKNEDSNKDNPLKREYSTLLKKYTSLDYTYESIDQNIQKRLCGEFTNGYDCSMYLTYDSRYAIRFKGDMTATEFDDVFTVLIKDLGNPDFFCDYEGYVWKKDGFYIIYGLYSLNYNYEVPMICVSANDIGRKMAYNRYSAVAQAISNPLIARGLNPQKIHYYKIAFFREFGFGVTFESKDTMVSINYDKNTLEISFVPLRPEGEVKGLELESGKKRQMHGITITNLEKSLNKLLEETKDYHGLNIISA
ncbi:MAG: hypothetical protein IKC48_00510 [Clostridia bacterium]|nr:hypothetical protein [Clostridia bacterium]